MIIPISIKPSLGVDPYNAYNYSVTGYYGIFDSISTNYIETDILTEKTPGNGVVVPIGVFLKQQTYFAPLVDEDYAPKKYVDSAIGSIDFWDRVLISLGVYKLTPGTAGDRVDAVNFVSTIATGTQPYACTSTTLNTNLNADMADGYHFNQGVQTADSVTFANITDSGLNNTTMIYSNGSKVLTSLANGTANQVLGMNAAANGFEYKTISGTTNQITVTQAANSVAISFPSDIIVAPGSMTLVQQATGGAVVDQSSTDFDSFATDNPAWQSFIAGMTGWLTAVDISNESGVTPTVTVSIYSGTGTGGTLLGSHAGVNPIPVGITNVTFTPTIYVTKGSVYTIAVTATSLAFWWTVKTVGTYTGGSYMGTAKDAVFNTYVDGWAFDVRNNHVNISGLTAISILCADASKNLISLANGTADQMLGMNHAVNGFEYKTLTSTANQVTVTHSAGAVTFSTPQDIATGSSPIFADLTDSGLTATTMIYANASKVLTSLANGTADQILGMNHAANGFEYKTLTSTANQVTVTHATNTVTFSTPQDIATTSNLTFANLTLGSNTAAATTALTLNAAANQELDVQFQSGGSTDWRFYRPASDNSRLYLYDDVNNLNFIQWNATSSAASASMWFGNASYGGAAINIVNSAAGDGYLTFYSASTAKWALHRIASSNNCSIDEIVGGTTPIARMNFVAGGKIGIGTSTPDSGASARAGAGLHVYNSTVGTTTWAGRIVASGPNYAWVCGEYNGYVLCGGNNAALSAWAAVRTDSNWGFGVVPTHTIHVAGGGDIWHDQTDAQAYCGFVSNNTDASHYWRIHIGTNERLFIAYDGTWKGDFLQTDGTYTKSSDRRLKDNIRPLSNIMDKIKQLKASYFTLKCDPEQKEKIGFIAQDVLPYFPELVSQQELTKDSEDMYYGLSYDGFGVIAIAGAQEQQVLIEKQQIEIDSLNERIIILEQKNNLS